MRKSQAARLESKGYDLDLIRKVQNPGPTIFHSDFIDYGDGVATIVSIYDFPNTVQGQMWFRNLLDTKNTITLMKIGTEDKSKLQKVINTNLNANQGVLNDKWASNTRQLAANSELRQNVQDLDAALNGHEVFKRLYTRVLFVAKSLTDLKQQVNDFKKRLQDYHMKVYAGEMATQMQQFTVPAMDVHSQGLNDLGFPMNSHALAGTYPFNQTFLSDPRGAYIGTTFQKGEIMFDPSHTDGMSRLTAYNLIVGDSGTGKSTYMHQNIDPLFARGDIIWTFDSTRRYIDHFKALDGLILTMDGSHNRINPLHVYATRLKEDGSVDAIASFTRHIDKFQTFYKTIRPKASESELDTLAKTLTTFYIDEWRLWARHPEEHPEALKAVRPLASDQYPTLEEYVTFLRAQEYLTADFTANELTNIGDIIRTLETLITRYGAMVNGHTTVPDLQKEQVVLFDTSGIASIDERVFSAMNFNILSLMNAYVIMNGQVQLKRQQKGEFTEKTARRGLAAPRYFWWIQDEADDLFNAGNPMGTIFADKMMQQQRKNYFGFFAIFPGLKNVIPGGELKDSEASRAIKDFFNRFQNLHLFRLPINETTKLRDYISQSDMTDAQFSVVNDLNQRQLLLNIRGFQATFMTGKEATATEKRMYNGGL